MFILTSNFIRIDEKQRKNEKFQRWDWKPTDLMNSNFLDLCLMPKMKSTVAIVEDSYFSPVSVVI